jgi:UDP-2,3-diacylglucosamine hydrolase
LSHTLFISDLHLPAGPSPLREAFGRFLAGPARGAEAVYILGDLFEVWIGDDAGLAEYAREASALRALTDSGVPVYFQHGNRDFLVGPRFAEATGVRLLPDPAVVDLHGTPTLISHGDLFCTDDVRYQRWRRFARNRLIQAVFNRLPRATRERIAGGVRAGTTADMKSKPLDIMDANESAIEAAFGEHGVARLIHGHTHRPRDHRHVTGRSESVRHVLADWQPGRCEALRVDSTGVERVKLDG